MLAGSNFLMEEKRRLESQIDRYNRVLEYFRDNPKRRTPQNIGYRDRVCSELLDTFRRNHQISEDLRSYSKSMEKVSGGRQQNVS